MLDLFGRPPLHEDLRTLEVDVVTLDAALDGRRFPHLDYLKLDIEGIEYEVLEAAPRCVESAFALKVEASFLEQRTGQKRAWEVMQLLTDRGFIIADILDPHRWRRRPVPADPYLTRYEMPYSRGLLSQCDLLAVRPAVPMQTDRARRAILLSAALGYFDHAVALARANAEATKRLDDVTGGLEAALARAAKEQGRVRVLEEMQANSRQFLPLVRSLLGRLPHRSDLMRY
jgi:hypothetical protein